MKRISAVLLLCLVMAMAPISAFSAETTGWKRTGNGWRYDTADGSYLTGACWIEAENNRYLFDETGILQTGDADGDVLNGGNLYFINPEKNMEDPGSCYAVRNYARVRPEGITYYDEDGVTFVGWMRAENDRYRYQTRIQDSGKKDLYIYVWRAQYLPESVHPEHPDDPTWNIPAGWYLFDDEGLWIGGDGVYSCADGHTYQLENGKITAQDGKMLTPPSFQPVPMNQLANRKSLQSHASDAELAQAYAVALEITAPLSDQPMEDQLLGIAIALRQRFENGIRYSMSEPHYDDPYGYFVTNVASCAGCARATGLCLNILGIPYEHVNENQYSHQWCRVNVNGTYWICDAYGLCCGPEPAPYQHPYL